MAISRPYPTSDTQNIRALRSDGPMTLEELPNSSGFSPEEKQYIFQIKMHAVYTGGSKKRENPTGIAYLIGDERRAVRRFIEMNEEFVESCMEDNSNPIQSRVDDFMWALFCEEWYWDHMDEVPKEVYQGPTGDIHVGVDRDEAGRLTAERKVSGTTGSSVISLPPDMVEEMELEGGEKLHVAYTDRGILYSREEPDIEHEKMLTVIATEHSEGHTSYTITVPKGYDELEYGDVATITALGTGQFVIAP